MRETEVFPSGTEIDNYTLQSIYQNGAFGEIYDALEMPSKRSVLLRLLPPEINQNIPALEQLTIDVNIYVTISHPNLSRILAMSENKKFGRWYMVMEKGAGKPLLEWIKNRELPAAGAIMVLKQVLTGMLAAHEKHVLHSDFNTACVMVAPDYTVKITNFSFRESAWSHKSREFLAPEMATGKSASNNLTDIYAIGFTIRKMFESLGVARFPLDIRRIAERMTIQDTKIRSQSLSDVLAPLNAKVPGNTKADAEKLLAKSFEKSFAEQREVTKTITIQQKSRFLPKSILAWAMIVALVYGAVCVYKNRKTSGKNFAVALMETTKDIFHIAKKASGIEMAEQAKKMAEETKVEAENAQKQQTAALDSVLEDTNKSATTEKSATSN